MAQSISINGSRHLQQESAACVMTLEDDFCDIIKKSRHGQHLSPSFVASQCHISRSDLDHLEKATRLPTQEEVALLSQTLNLRSEPLQRIAQKGWLPNDMPDWVMQGGLLTTILGNIGGYEVKGYILTDPITNDSIMIDTGYNATQMLETLAMRALNLRGICLTHGHADHAGGLDALLSKWKVPVYIGKEDLALLDWRPPKHVLQFLDDKHTISFGSLTLECLSTPGHTPGGYCYRLWKNGHSLCFVGDTLFAGSVGRSNPFSLYQTHLHSVRQIVLTLSGETVLLPGHGPPTTVQEERDSNPFA
ncbi:MAG: MBL fold metallo-hydrolase [Nitrospirales bacterium]|nr:MBL fold metallo-hydrolase [Nitrospira sp.]MDR4500782.1 MBL fold metallo-hydrolase [Nitrospirales bacterium]